LETKLTRIFPSPLLLCRFVIFNHIHPPTHSPLTHPLHKSKCSPPALSRSRCVVLPSLLPVLLASPGPSRSPLSGPSRLLRRTSSLLTVPSTNQPIITRPIQPPSTSIKSCVRLLIVGVGRIEVKAESDLLPAGAAPGTVPSDLEQATGLERLEILGKMEGVDIFDMKPLDASRRGAYPPSILLLSSLFLCRWFEVAFYLWRDWNSGYPK
jgi:hypothetical protein